MNTFAWLLLEQFLFACWNTAPNVLNILNVFEYQQFHCRLFCATGSQDNINAWKFPWTKIYVATTFRVFRFACASLLHIMRRNMTNRWLKPNEKIASNVIIEPKKLILDTSDCPNLS